MLINITRAAVIAVAMTLPVAMQAQRGMGGPGGRMGGVGPAGNPVAPLIDMRRELNLSSRQLTQLDSIERSVLQRNQALRERLRARMDSMRPRTRDSGEAEIQRFRAESDSLRALRQVIVRNDSVARAAAMAVLTDSQRIHVRERLAERRGFAAGRMSTMRGGQRGFRGRQGMPGQGPRMRQERGGRGMVGPGMRQRGGMPGPDGFGARRFDDRRMMPDDSVPMRRFRRPPADGIGPDSLNVAPRRRPMDGMQAPAPRFRRPPVDNER